MRIKQIGTPMQDHASACILKLTDKRLILTNERNNLDIKHRNYPENKDYLELANMLE